MKKRKPVFEAEVSFRFVARLSLWLAYPSLWPALLRFLLSVFPHLKE